MEAHPRQSVIQCTSCIPSPFPKSNVCDFISLSPKISPIFKKKIDNFWTVPKMSRDFWSFPKMVIWILTVPCSHVKCQIFAPSSFSLLFRTQKIKFNLSLFGYWTSSLELWVTTCEMSCMSYTHQEKTVSLCGNMTTSSLQSHTCTSLYSVSDQTLSSLIYGQKWHLLTLKKKFVWFYLFV